MSLDLLMNGSKILHHLIKFYHLGPFFILQSFGGKRRISIKTKHLTCKYLLIELDPYCEGIFDTLFDPFIAPFRSHAAS